jgi:hypothetical protein
MTAMGNWVAKGLAVVGPCWLALGSCLALAEGQIDEQPRAFDSEFLRKANSIEAGPLRIYPVVQAGYGYDDNILESADHEIASNFATLMPEISALWQQTSSAVQLGYRAAAIKYFDSSDDDFTGQQAFARGRLEAGYRNRFGLDIDAKKSNEPRGTGLTMGLDPDSPDIPKTPDEFTDKNAALRYEFGARGAQGLLRLYGSTFDHEYTNHRDRTRFFDREESLVGGAFVWRVFPLTSAVLEMRMKDISYDVDQPGASTLDSKERDILLGAEWEITEATLGSFRIGQKDKDFDADDRDDASTTAWELSAKWTPRGNSRFNVRVERAPQETSGVGDFVDTRTAEVSWEEQWLERLGTKLRYKNMNEDYQNGDRSQKTNEVQFDVNYTMYHWLVWSLTGVVRDRSSDTASLEFDRNIYRLGVEVRL